MRDSNLQLGIINVIQFTQLIVKFRRFQLIGEMSLLLHTKDKSAFFIHRDLQEHEVNSRCEGECEKVFLEK